MIELGTKWPNTTTIGKLRVQQMDLAMCVVLSKATNEWLRCT